MRGLISRSDVSAEVWLNCAMVTLSGNAHDLLYVLEMRSANCNSHPVTVTADKTHPVKHIEKQALEERELIRLPEGSMQYRNAADKELPVLFILQEKGPNRYWLFPRRERCEFGLPSSLRDLCANGCGKVSVAKVLDIYSFEYWTSDMTMCVLKYLVNCDRRVKSLRDIMINETGQFSCKGKQKDSLMKFRRILMHAYTLIGYCRDDDNMWQVKHLIGCLRDACRLLVKDKRAEYDFTTIEYWHSILDCFPSTRPFQDLVRFWGSDAYLYKNGGYTKTDAYVYEQKGNHRGVINVETGRYHSATRTMLIKVPLKLRENDFVRTSDDTAVDRTQIRISREKGLAYVFQPKYSIASRAGWSTAEIDKQECNLAYNQALILGLEVDESDRRLIKCPFFSSSNYSWDALTA